MKLLIVVHHRLELWNVPVWFGERLAQEFAALQVVQRNSYEAVEEHLRDAEVIFTISLRPEQFAVARQLRWIHAPTAAVHQFLFAELLNSSVVLTNSREVHGPVVAEHVMALILALAKKIPQAVVLQQKQTWGEIDNTLLGRYIAGEVTPQERFEVETALEELPEEQREVFIAHEIMGYTFKEISAKTGVGINTLLSRKRYAVLFLRECLRAIYEEFIPQ